MRQLRPATLEQDGFALCRFDKVLSEEFQRYHDEVYSTFKPGENASNSLARAVRWGIRVHDETAYVDRREYSLTALENPEEQGRVRRFGLIPDSYLRRPEVEDLVDQLFDRWCFTQSSSERAYEVQLSAIRYEPSLASPAWPSPVIPHQDRVDGAIVVMAKTGNLAGGTTRLYTLNDEPLYELDLEAGEALLIRDARLKHQVTPILLAPGGSWRPGRRAYRDILIVRFQAVGR